MMFVFSLLILPILDMLQALWAVQEWNKKWLFLQRRKSDLQVNFKGRTPVGVTEKEKIIKNVLRCLEDAESEQAIDDCESQFNLHFPVDASEAADCGFKRPRFRSLYSIGHQAGLGNFTKHFGLTSEAFGDNVKAGYKVNVVVLLLLYEALTFVAHAHSTCNEHNLHHFQSA